jgi:hypothetical protein
MNKKIKTIINVLEINDFVKYQEYQDDLGYQLEFESKKIDIDSNWFNNLDLYIKEGKFNKQFYALSMLIKQGYNIRICIHISHCGDIIDSNIYCYQHKWIVSFKELLSIFKEDIRDEKIKNIINKN